MEQKVTSGDVGYSIAKGILGAVPIIGSTGAEIFGLLVVPPLEKRRVKWFNEVGERLKELEKTREGVLEELRDNPEFTDTLIHATTLALKHSSAEKIEAFQNAIINTAVGQAPEITVREMFLSLLDSFTVSHIQILDLVNDPKEWFERNNMPLPDYHSSVFERIIKIAFPKINDELIKVLWRDLKNASMTNFENLSVMFTREGLFSSKISPLGRDFLKFIKIQE